MISLENTKDNVMGYYNHIECTNNQNSEKFIFSMYSDKNVCNRLFFYNFIVFRTIQNCFQV